MGEILNICCSKNDHNYNQTETNLSSSRTQNDFLDHPESRPPLNIIQMKIKTKDLITKRDESPLEHYSIELKLGSGAYGTVYKVKHKDSNIYRTMKVIDKNFISSGFNSIEVNNEIQILRRLDHPHIMKLYEFYEDEDNFYIVTEFLEEGDLAKKLRKYKTFSEINVKYFMYQVLCAVSYLHDNKVIHGDIKLENILLTRNDNDNALANRAPTTSNKFVKKLSFLNEDSKVNPLLMSMDVVIKGKKNYNSIVPKNKNSIQRATTISYLKDVSVYDVKLIDFGCSKIFNKKKISGIIGTSYYCSPEVIDNQYDEKCDEWACGVLMYILLTGVPPFDGKTEEEVFNKIKHNEIKFPKILFEFISEDCIDLIRHLCIKDPKKRITASEALKSKFFKSEDLDMEADFIDDIDNDLINEAMNDLKQSHAFIKKNKSKFIDAVWAYLVFNFVGKDEEKKVRKIFNKINKDHSKGTINRQDFHFFIDNYFKNNFTQEEIDDLFDTIDEDKSEGIEYQELLRVLVKKNNLLNKENLRSAFDLLDVDDNGKITWDDINHVIFKDNEVDEKLMNEYMGQIGKNKNDKISFDEFCDLIINGQEID